MVVLSVLLGALLLMATDFSTLFSPREETCGVVDKRGLWGRSFCCEVFVQSKKNKTVRGLAAFCLKREQVFVLQVSDVRRLQIRLPRNKGTTWITHWQIDWRENHVWSCVRLFLWHISLDFQSKKKGEDSRLGGRWVRLGFQPVWCPTSHSLVFVAGTHRACWPFSVTVLATFSQFWWHTGTTNLGFQHKEPGLVVCGVRRLPQSYPGKVQPVKHPRSVALKVPVASGVFRRRTRVWQETVVRKSVVSFPVHPTLTMLQRTTYTGWMKSFVDQFGGLERVVLGQWPHWVQGLWALVIFQYLRRKLSSVASQ